MMKKILCIATLSFTLLGCKTTLDLDTDSVKPSAAPAPVTELVSTPPLNIIMVVADGMGPAYTSGFRYYNDDPTTPEVETNWFERHHVGNSSTYPASVSGLVTDSAASATALASGVKSYNGAIGVDINKQPVTTVLHTAKLKGMRTGLAVTSQIVHATPAAYVAHNENRRNYDAIADSYFDDRVDGQFKVDVMLGGGTKYFKREGRDLTAEFVGAGYVYVDDYAELADVPQGSKLLGLMAPVGLPWALDDPQAQRLQVLTEQAVRHLENPEGFFLLVEASQVDWAGHGRDINGAMAEMSDLHETLLWIEEYQKTHPNTLVVVTADHSTGGLTLAANGEYRWSPEDLHQINMSVPKMIETMLAEQMNGTERVNFISEQLGFALTADQEETLVLLDMTQQPRPLEDVIKRMIDTHTNTGWTTHGHTAIDVQIFAHGPHQDMFAGYLDNTEIAKRIFAILEK
ncbi:alkaline phosphatase [Opacimonas viscosa]|uniref:Alkaline phosphatase n=1 Tax=Opacimonas viscosa TaxID=2961944 RepID=A0AA41WXU4_9ALTE|nr:alkaline phosphatase [Opacimonas viscosa]MCP3428524.1 alkaline phosphatase [Opacimonas viscosa]